MDDCTVTASLHNLVSSLLLSFPFRLIEVIKGLDLHAVENLDSSLDLLTSESLEPYIFEIGENLTVHFEMQRGSHIFYEVSFGDGTAPYQSNLTESLFGIDHDIDFTHTYNRFGLFSITASIANDVGNSSLTISDIVEVYEVIEGLVHNALCLDYDEAVLRVDVLRLDTEPFVRAHGTTNR